MDDYISKEGLVKRTLTFLGINAHDDYGYSIGTCDTYDIYELKSYTK